MASTISVRGEPERVNLVVRALEPDNLLLVSISDRKLGPSGRLAARVKVHNRPYSFEDGPLRYINFRNGGTPAICMWFYHTGRLRSL